ncbi:hypothetical protein RGQ29_023713 [Quercus rubra]|uniref:Vitellogenin-like protein n=1 Tax=Quercus rubra TaxID=3512 RepID=A0AAN7F5G3_QUERU|nr:hypothetical protein RGQ29_023713 [Quercus rubra]
MMEGIKGIVVPGGGGRVGVGEEDMGDGMQCSDHPYRNNPGGICAFCLQEKLGKLVSSSFPLPIRGSSSSSSSPSFRSDIGNAGACVGAGSSSSLSIRPLSSTRGVNDGGNKDSHFHHHQYYSTRRARIPFLLAKKKKKVTSDRGGAAPADIIFKRSKSTATPRRRNQFLNAEDGDEDFSPRKRGGFWSFLYFSTSSSSKPSVSRTTDRSFRDDNSNSNSNSKIPTLTTGPTTNGSNNKQKEKCHLGSSSLGKKSDIVEDDESPNSQATASASSFERKVSRSRSVGCGSRSFSGDFFERISTGFGDCTLRRVESQREGKPKSTSSAVHMKERVKCGGLFVGAGGSTSASSLVHGRSKSWGWAFASPMRAFSKPNSKDGKRDIIRQASDKNTNPNLAAIPSLLSVRG